VSPHNYISFCTTLKAKFQEWCGNFLMIFAGLEYKLHLIHQLTSIAHIILLDFYDCGQGIRNGIDF
jgi:hypothetical protein